VSTLRRFFSKIVVFLTFLNSKIDFIILKTDDKQFTITTKKSLHIIFEGFWWNDTLFWEQKFSTADISHTVWKRNEIWHNDRHWCV